MYFASWRDPSPNAFPPTEKEKPPAAILFVARFGVAPYELSPSLVETAEAFNRLDRAHLRLDLVRGEDDAFLLDGLEVELNVDSTERRRMFRSCWKGDEIGTLDLSLQFEAPATRLEPFRFHLRGNLPRRYNHLSPVEEEHLEFTASGGAMPLPSWVNY
jgi:hypothetical protein